jgi:Fusaric acid resistance protein-like
VTHAGREWLRRRDPDLVAVRRAARITIVASVAFYVPYYVLRNPDMATYGLFSAVAMGFLAQLPGPARRESVTVLRALPVALLLVTAGTLLAGNLWAAAAGVLVTGFVIAFAGAGGPGLAGVAAGLQLFFILACFPPYAAQTLGSRLIGVLAGMGLLAAGAWLLWPDRPRVSYRQVLANASDALAGELRAGGAGRSVQVEWPAEASWPPGVPPAARPTSASRRDRALKDAGRALSFTLARLRELPDGARPPPAAVEPLRRAAETATAAAKALRGGPPPPTDELRQALSVVRSSQPQPPEDAERAVVTGRYLAAAEGVWSMATATRVALGAPVESGQPSPRFPYANLGLVSLWWQRFAVHLTPRSVYFQGAVRIALALAAARLVAGTLELSHGFWVLLATLTLLRGRAATTGMTLGPAAVGTVAGAGVVGLLLVVVGPRPEVYAALTPPIMVVTFAAGTLFGLAWGQALFTVVVTLVFTQLAPSGVQIAEVRVIDVIVGALVGVTAGVLAWPRGATAELRRSAAGLLLSSADLVRETAHALMTPGAPPGSDRSRSIFRVRQEVDLVEAAYGTDEAERRPTARPRPDWRAVITTGDHAARGAGILLDTRDPGSLAQWPVVNEWAGTVGNACDAVATALRRGQDPSDRIPTVGPAPDAMIVDVQAWLAGVAEDLGHVGSAAPDR